MTTDVHAHLLLPAMHAEVERRAPELVAEAVERARSGRSGLYDVTVRVADEVVAEFRGRARQVPGLPGPT